MRQSATGIRVLSLVLLAACAAPPASTHMGAGPIKIGAVLPFSGGVELYGEQAKLGLDLAVREINAGGGILGRAVELIYADDADRLTTDVPRSSFTLAPLVPAFDRPGDW